ncbi:MAG: mechanosensitive ion channel family protein [Bacteroidetes bacterium]|nr:MAG: mechanosensitive ion channel family protein [Bacteroidota bacterium]
MNAFFSKEFYGNTVLDWVIAMSIIIASILLAKLTFFLLGRFIKQFTKRTKSKLDDIIIDKFEEPAVFGIIILGIWYGINSLSLSDGVHTLLVNTYYFLITFNVAWFITRLLDAIIEEYLVPVVEKTETDLDDQLLPVLRKAIRIAIWILAIVVGLNNAGYDIGTIIAGLGLGGLAFALAAKDSLSHLFGGFVLFTDKPFTINDRVLTNGFDGIVKEIGMRSTRIRVLDGREVTLPNADIANNSIVNVSSEPDRKITVDLALTYKTSTKHLRLAMELLKQLTVENSNVNEAKTVTAFTEFSDFSLKIRFIYYIKKGASVFDTMTEVNFEVLEKFNANGLDFAFPTQTIYNVN